MSYQSRTSVSRKGKKPPHGPKSPFPAHMNAFFESTLPGFEELCGSHDRVCAEREEKSGERSHYVQSCTIEFMSRFGEELVPLLYTTRQNVVTTLLLPAWKRIYKQKYTNHLQFVWITEKRTAKHKKPILRLSKRRILTGRRVFERIQKADLKKELNAHFHARIRTIAESHKVPAAYQKILKMRWDNLSEDEQKIWEDLAKEEVNGTFSRDDRNLQIEQNRLEFPVAMVDLFQGLMGYDVDQVGNSVFHIFYGWRSEKGTVYSGSLTVSESGDLNFMDSSGMDDKLGDKVAAGWSNFCEEVLPNSLSELGDDSTLSGGTNPAPSGPTPSSSSDAAPESEDGGDTSSGGSNPAPSGPTSTSEPGPLSSHAPSPDLPPSSRAPSPDLPPSSRAPSPDLPPSSRSATFEPGLPPSLAPSPELGASTLAPHSEPQPPSSGVPTPTSLPTSPAPPISTTPSVNEPTQEVGPTPEVDGALSSAASTRKAIGRARITKSSSGRADESAVQSPDARVTRQTPKRVHEEESVGAAKRRNVTKAARGTPKRSGNLGSDDGEKASPKTGRGARTKMKSSKLAYMQGEVNESAHRKSRRGK